MTVKIKDLEVADDAMSIVHQEVRRIASLTDRDEREIAKLEKLVKTYAVLMASFRENLKNGIFGKLSAEELQDTVNSAGDGPDAGDEGDEPL